MKKSLLALAVLGTLAGVASAQSSVTIYGRVDESFAKPTATKDKQIADGGGAGGSRLGFKGTEDLGNGLSAVFRFEHGFTPDTGVQADGSRFWNRYSMVGLSHQKFGTLSLGRLENGAWDVITSFDPFGGDGTAELRDVGSSLRTRSFDIITTGKTPSTNPSAGEFDNSNGNSYTLDSRRLDNAVRYDIAYQGFKASASIAEATKEDKPWAVGGSYTAGPIYVGAGYEKLTADKGKMWIVGGAYDFGIAKVSANYAAGTTAKDYDVKGFLAGVTVPYGALVFKAGYAQSKVDFGGTTGEQTYKKGGLGVDYNLSKRTKLYADYARIAGDVGADNGPADKNKNGYDVGIRHSF